VRRGSQRELGEDWDDDAPRPGLRDSVGDAVGVGVRVTVGRTAGPRTNSEEVSRVLPTAIACAV
jgi:hypothetical protein